MAEDNMHLFMTTEHFTLMTARSSSVSETNGRATLYLATLSSSIVALALVAQISDIGVLFYTFAFVLLPMVYFLGLVTAERVLQLNTEYFVYQRSINRIRAYYAHAAPEMAKYYIIPATDDPAATLSGIGIASRWQRYLTLGGTISAVNSLVAGVFFGLVAGVILHKATTLGTGALLASSSGIGTVAFVLLAAAWFRHQRRQFFGDYGHQVPTMFPVQGETPPYPVR